MVGRNTSVFVCVLAVLLSISNVFAAFKCYECNSATDSRCSDEFHKSSKFESTATCLGCSKSKLNGASELQWKCLQDLKSIDTHAHQTVYTEY
ncbi:hypothetical protein DPMN_068641 [Dreissena polymorpha]|uniref:Protein quiver n=1 Tax=Dreissena polymorpha TaxID=45954 RepID=A0A9D3Z052_DREPO|nr:hypothetical protein DPMN_068641 [Dreissena polymorpha]